MKSRNLYLEIETLETLSSVLVVVGVRVRASACNIVHFLGLAILNKVKTTLLR